MFEVYNMGVGFCVLAAEQDAAAILAILQNHGRRAQVIGRVVEDEARASICRASNCRPRQAFRRHVDASPKSFGLIP